MKTTAIVATLALLAAGLTLLPTAQASQPPCYTYVGGCCGAFAPCCSPISCPPPVARCPDLDVDTSSTGPYLVAPRVNVETDSDCSANACVNTSDCSDAACSVGAHTCCSIDGTMSYCTTLQSGAPCTVPLSSAAAALPLPHVGYTLNGDCSVTVTETYDCPNGFLDARVHYDAGPADAWADYCVPMCACMPIEMGVLRSPVRLT